MLMITQINVNDRAIDRQRDVVGNALIVSLVDRFSTHPSMSGLRHRYRGFHLGLRFLERNRVYAVFAREAQLLARLGGLLRLPIDGLIAVTACSKPQGWRPFDGAAASPGRGSSGTTRKTFVDFVG